MNTSNELISIFDRIRDGIQNESDILLLSQWLKNNTNQNILQVGNNIINIGDSKNIHIGDRIYYSTDAENIKAVIREVLTEFIHNGVSPEKSPQPQSNSSTQQLTPPPISAITKFEFEVVTLDEKGRKNKHELKQVEYFIENLADGVVLEMVSVVGGKFQMGTSLEESESLEDERPQHIVTLKPFFIGRYPITQMQWEIVANLPKINSHLDIKPSCFQGNNLPVERVSWHDAQEFCERLAQKTGRKYRLPSEAQWEYACRAKTLTPFHFGKIITTNFVNYCEQDGNINSIYRQQTTEVGSFLPNAFGIYDMHGLIWEWCDDCEHEDYQGAPLDGSSWVNNGNCEYRILRGGSWNSPRRFCRSGSRFSENATVRDQKFGFRVIFAE